MGVGWALIRGWALINFFSFWDGQLFEVGANSRLGAYSNKYGSRLMEFKLMISHVIFHLYTNSAAPSPYDT